MESEQSRDSFNSEYDDEDYYEDDEATIEEEEKNLTESVVDELKELENDNQLSVEELRRKYYGNSYEDEEKTNPINCDDVSSTVINDIQYNEVVSTSSVKEISETAVLVSDLNDSSLDDEEDEEYIPETYARFRLLQIGERYQAVIPKYNPNKISRKRKAPSGNNWCEYRGAKLWVPTDRISNTEMDKYIEEATKLLNGDKSYREEDLLYLLLKSNYEIKLALSLIPDALEHVQLPVKTIPPTGISKPFTECEINTFETAIRIYGKNFFSIQANTMHNRTVGELVQFYYFWKKTDRYKEYKKRFEANNDENKVTEKKAYLEGKSEVHIHS
ncbi:ELM2 domain and SANT/Myb domain and Homeodomain-like and SANT domain-containing protein [Strongyloides ratti]|uniref:ELM2 domain and SANT/Myb domain and Homeodomain-like and SANT domain-containing protein n=1 Tax=Strongyloides ratti TaxID=34506 RepID=A0A090LMA8_STRRB|nr:ELM2 domain and SANT/Myb domain and Homeodomain-like and SANT domain-containing protein [Strongyloides ratti]CEF68675.1 ELM2 domain and SANT/Myb domain and Homeodomain-like and SANT domain-containing protein [Strongyloides ratti]